MDKDFYLLQTKKLVARTAKSLVDETNKRYKNEEAFWQCVEKGDSEAFVVSPTKNIPSVIWRRRFYGDNCIRDLNALNESELYDLMNIFIAICARRAIKGGAEATEIFILADLVRNDFKNNRSAKNLLDLMNACAYSMATLIRENKQKEEGRTGKIKAFIRANLYRKLSVGDISKELKVNYNTLSAFFCKNTETKLKQYILTEKCEEAKRLLLHTDEKLADIAALLGFSSQAHFQRIFMQKVGCTPRAFRNRS